MPLTAPHPHPHPAMPESGAAAPDEPTATALTDEEAAALREVYQHPAQPQCTTTALLQALAARGLIVLECRWRLDLVFVCGRVTAAGRTAVVTACPNGAPVVSLGPDIYFHADDQLAEQPIAVFGLGVIGTIQLVSHSSRLWVGHDRRGTALTAEVSHDEATLAVYDAARPELVEPIATHAA